MEIPGTIVTEGRAARLAIRAEKYLQQPGWTTARVITLQTMLPHEHLKHYYQKKVQEEFFGSAISAEDYNVMMCKSPPHLQ